MMALMLRGRLLALIGLLALLMAACGNAGGAGPNCLKTFIEVEQELMNLFQRGNFDKAQEKAEYYKPCYEHDVEYWLTRVSLLPTAGSDTELSEEDGHKASFFLEEALKREPDNKLIWLTKSVLLFEQKRTDEAIALYESSVTNIDQIDRNRVPPDVTHVLALDIVPAYTTVMAERGETDRAHRVLQPLLGLACEDSKLKAYYANTLHLVEQHLAGDDAVAGGVDQDCSHLLSYR